MPGIFEGVFHGRAEVLSTLFDGVAVLQAHAGRIFTGLLESESEVLDRLDKQASTDT